MSIASELNWTTASKPKFGKATEHSGAKKGKGAWDKKKVAKKDSNKGRRAGGKQEIKDQTVGDESDGPFAGSAPLFKKAAAMHWTTAEPRPCYPTEDPVEDHCNDGIAPPAPGGGDNMEYGPGDIQYPSAEDWVEQPGGSPGPIENPGDSGFFHEGAPPVEPGYKEDPDDTLERQWKADDKFAEEQRPAREAEQQKQWDHEEDLEIDRKAEEDRESMMDEPVDDFGDADPWDDFDELQDPLENAGPAQPEEAPAPEPTGEAWRNMMGNDFPGAAKEGERGGGGRQQGPRDLQMSGPHDARDPGLSPDAPHQFWAQDSPHVQDALNKYLMPQLNSPNPEIAQKAQRILREGPHAE